MFTRQGKRIYDYLINDVATNGASSSNVEEIEGNY